MKLRRANRMGGIIALALLMGAVPAHSQAPELVPQAASSGQAAAEPGVVAVRIIGEDGRVLSESSAGIAVETGKPLASRPSKEP